MLQRDVLRRRPERVEGMYQTHWKPWKDRSAVRACALYCMSDAGFACLLMAIELRNQLAALAETPLSATLAFDYPPPMTSPDSCL